MKLTLLLSTALYSLSSFAAMSLNDCVDFTKSLNYKSENLLAGSANECKSVFIDSLNKEVYKLDKSKNDCQSQLSVVKEVTISANEFFEVTTNKIDSIHPDSRVRENMDDTILDMAYALNDMNEQRDCIFDEFVKTKADAQVKSLVLSDTEFVEIKDL